MIDHRTNLLILIVEYKNILSITMLDRNDYITIRIKISTLKEIFYFLNDWLRLMSYGSEYSRLSRLVRKIFKEDYTLKLYLNDFHYMRRVIEAFEYLERQNKN